MSNKLARQSLLAISVLGNMIAIANANDTQTNEVTQLEKIVITASGFEQDIKKAAASISVLTQEEINKKAYRDVTDALKDVPGVVVTGGGSSSDISIRGMGSAYTVIMVDGKKVNTRSVRPNSDNSGIEQGWLPNIGAIERIEVIRGPMSGLYGSDAMGGVINIITKKNTNEWTGSIKLDTTLQENSKSGNIYQTNAYIAGPLIANLLSFKANGLYSQRDEDEIYGGYSEQKIRAGGAALTLTPNDQHTFDLEYQRSIQNRDATVGKSISPIQTGRNPPVNSLTDYYRTEYSLTHRGTLGAVETHSYIQREENENPSRNMEAINTTFNTINKINFDRHSLSFGGMYLKEELEDKGNQLSIGGSTPVSSLDRYSWALFAENAWNIVDDFTLTTSLRLDEDEKFGDHWSPKVYGVWGLNDNWVIKGGVSTGYKTPALRATVAEWGQATGGGQSKGVIVGNPDLKPEKSVNYEVSFNWDNLDNLNAGLTLFNSEFKDKITEVRTCQGENVGALECDWLGEKFDFVSLRENVDKASMRGAEVTFGWQALPNVNVSANYTFTDTEQKSGINKGKPLNEMPKHMFNTTADWEINDQFSSWGRVNYRSKTSDYLSRTAMAKGKPAYTMVDVGLNYKPTQNIAVAAGVYNLFDKEIDKDTYNYVLDGRRYNIGVTYSF
ncbi:MULTISPECIES: ligand-gated channel protein [Acinetobacter]|jgi:outer membrane receptor for ferrienterochelin and colicins|uniref:ligand-gated channel protein n=1 Tax=Acinetobacter TaxID=469 RepID=UPI0007756357|nr:MULTISPECIES: ligand-gated channel protein [Acinetobacter]KXO82725.1 outer membrane siderophore receptor [Acinetobacter venetianus]MBC68605.1 ligand-gated channel protein [Acinetobacter sp.]MBT50997.1 ligand-gated channel protein [Acinetobacter sp.]HIQ34083.1 ligand-gated channel protein [Acinetobacter venetianus]HJP47625.1 ligand-gated channel protein [Acinetobacter venetianus]